MAGHSDGLEMVLNDFEEGLVFCKTCPTGSMTSGHCPKCGADTVPRRIDQAIPGGPSELPTLVLSRGGDIRVPWSMALEVSQSLDAQDGGGRAYCLRERREAERLLDERGLSAGEKEMAFTLLDGLLIGHARAAKDGQKWAIDHPRKPINKPN